MFTLPIVIAFFIVYVIRNYGFDIRKEILRKIKESKMRIHFGTYLNKRELEITKIVKMLQHIYFIF